MVESVSVLVIEDPQHLIAIRKANEFRCKRSILRRDLKAGRVDFSEVLLNPPEYILTMTIYDFIRSQHRWGDTRTMKVLKKCEISGTRALDRLTLRQKNEIIKLVYKQD